MSSGIRLVSTSTVLFFWKKKPFPTDVHKVETRILRHKTSRVYFRVLQKVSGRKNHLGFKVILGSRYVIIIFDLNLKFGESVGKDKSKKCKIRGKQLVGYGDLSFTVVFNPSKNTKSKEVLKSGSWWETKLLSVYVSFCTKNSNR